MRIVRPTCKALNKPLLIAGVDMRLAGIALILATVIGSADDRGAYKGFAIVFFLCTCAAARAATRRDPNLLVVWNRARRYRWLYDPAKRLVFGVIVSGRREK